jgi:EAL domain-containing protein (putative c-di-GMP-specific phosphodiesterase class I)
MSSLRNGRAGGTPEAATLYLTTPTARAERKLRGALTLAGLEAGEPYPGVICVSLTLSQLEKLAADWTKSLGRAELQHTKCRLERPGTQPTPSSLMQTQTLESMIAWIDGRWLERLIRDGRLITFFQPIVATASPGDIYAYECLLRGTSQDDQLISPDRLYNAARATGTLQHLDQEARLTAIRSVAREKLDTHAFINFNPRSIVDPKKCLRSIVDAVQSSGISAERLVFEVVECEEIDDLPKLLQILDWFRAAGFRVALDDLGAGYSSLNLLAELKPDFIKLDIGLVRNVHRDYFKSRVAAKLLELARELGVATVVEGVETEGQWRWAVEHGSNYAQGYLFARPGQVPPVSTFSGAPAEDRERCADDENGDENGDDAACSAESEAEPLAAASSTNHSQ